MKCPNCGAELENGVLFCKDCGYKLNNENDNKFCRECGAELEKGVKFCSYCGADVNAINKILKSNEEQEKENNKTEPESNNESKKEINVKNAIADKLPEIKMPDNIPSNLKAKLSNSKYIIIAAAVVIVFLIILIGFGSSNDDSNDVEQASINTLYQDGDYTIRKGTQYAYMSDEWNVYIITAMSDSVVKLEHWDKTLSSSKKMSLNSELGTYKINDPENGFAWIDEEHTSFTFTFSDKNNSRVKKAAQHIFTINISDSDVCKGTDYSEDIACYKYTCDDWHTYRAIPLSDHLIKIECWARSSSMDKLLFGWDWCLIDTNNTDTDFEWGDDEHTCFTITTQDPQNKSYWKEPTFVAFELENPNYKYSSVLEFLGGDLGSSRLEKDGYNDAKNTMINVGNYWFSIPTYWYTDISDSDNYRAYAESSGKVAMLQIQAVEDTDSVNYDVLVKENKSGSMATAFESWFDKADDATSESFSNKEIRGFLYSTDFTLEGYEGSAKCLCFPSVDDNKWFYVSIIVSNNTEFSYDSDFLKILESISKSKEVPSTTTTKKTETTTKASISMPIMSGSSIDSVVKAASSFGLSVVFDDDFGHGTRDKALSDSTGGLNLDIVYSTSSKEILCASITTNKLVSSSQQKAFVNGMASVICPSSDLTDVSSWVSSNVGGKTSTKINGFTYELSLGPVDNILFFAGQNEWEEWDLSLY